MPAQEIIPSGIATEATLATIAATVKAEDAAHASGDKGVPMLALRWASDAPTSDADGDYTLLKLDEEGRLKVASKPASYPDITGDITAVQAAIGTPVAGGTVSGDVSRASNVMMFCTGTFSGVNVSFEGSLEASGDTNWFSIQAVRSNANTIETATGALSAQPTYAWELSVNGLKRVRVRCTARTSGTQNWRFVLGTYATEPIPAAQASATQAVSGSVTVTLPTATATSNSILSAASTNAALIRNGVTNLYAVVVTNFSASTKYVRFYNKSTAPVPGTDTPVTILPVAAGAVLNINFGTPGQRFSTGLGIAITGGAAILDATAVAANDVLVNTVYL